MATDTTVLLTGPIVTIKAALAAGFHEQKDWEYGGEEITVKGKRLVRNPKEALSRTQWSERGYRIRKNAEPQCHRSVYFVGQGHLIYDVFRDDQVEPKRRVTPKQEERIDELASVWVINRRAKRCRDLATTHYKRGTHGFAGTLKEEKDLLYALKEQALHHLLAEGRLTIVGHHRFRDGNWAELLQGEGYSFHRPCPPQPTSEVEDRDEIEAKPKTAKEPRLKDAMHTIQAYLATRPKVESYRWPAKPRLSKTRTQSSYREFDFEEDEDEDRFFE